MRVLSVNASGRPFAEEGEVNSIHVATPSSARHVVPRFAGRWIAHRFNRDRGRASNAIIMRHVGQMVRSVDPTQLTMAESGSHEGSTG